MTFDAPPPLPSLFLHFFDEHYVEEVAPHIEQNLLLAEMSLATRLAVLAAARVYLPAASYFESPLCREVLMPLASLFTDNTIILTGSAASISEFAGSKLDQYRERSPQERAYRSVLNNNLLSPPYRARTSSSTVDLRQTWLEHLDRPAFEESLFAGLHAPLPLTLSQTWGEVPERLGADAFIPPYVVPLLFGANAAPSLTARVSNIINAGYFASFGRELRSGFVIDMTYLQGRHQLEGLAPDVAYAKTRTHMARSGALAKVCAATPEQLLELRNDADVVAALLEGIEKAPGVPTQQRIVPPTPVEVDAALAAVSRTKVGKADATRYHRRVTDLLALLFSGWLDNPSTEEPINSGRKRIDTVFTNIAENGFFRLMGLHHRATWVYCEAKNYTHDIANEEVDQLAGRFTKYSTDFGFLLCREVTKPEQLRLRCQDLFRAGRGLIIPLTDDDLTTLANFWVTHPADPQQEITRWLVAKARAIQVG